MDASVEELLTLFGVIGLGLALGKLSWRGLALGTSGVVFVALPAGHFGFTVPKIAGIVGIIVFVYCLGIGAGPSFLAALFHNGRRLLVVAVAMLGSAGLAAWCLAETMQLTPDLTAGLFAGALTSTPALAAAVESLPPDSEVAVGFGVAYPFGVLGVILFVQLVPKLLAKVAPDASTHDSGHDNDGPITRVLVEVTNPNVAGRRLSDVSFIARANCQVSRWLVDGELIPIPADFHLELSQRLLVIGAERRVREVVEVLGSRCDDANFVLDVERRRKRVVVTAKQLVGRKLRDLHLLSQFGVTISRIVRQDIEFVPNPQERIQYGDALTAVGEPAGLERFIQFAGHRERTLDDTDLVSLAIGLVLGVLLGQVELTYNGTSVSLGMAGGPLLVGLLLGHLGHVGPIVCRIPRAGRLLLSDIGLSLFLAQAGSQAGDKFLDVLQRYGLLLCLVSIAIVVVPMVVGLIVARFALRLSILETFGGICGAMTSTPGLGAITASVDSSVPATSYATVYPLALILITLLTPLLISLI